MKRIYLMPDDQGWSRVTDLKLDPDDQTIGYDLKGDKWSLQFRCETGELWTNQAGERGTNLNAIIDNEAP